MSLFSGIEKSIERGFRRWTERLFGAADASELMMTHRAILEEVETKVETLARGRRVFPFAHLTVTLVSSDANRRAILETAFGERLEADIREALEAAACEVPRGFSVEVRAAESGPNPFEIEYATPPAKKTEQPATPSATKAIEPATPATPATAPATPAAAPRLAVVKGKTDRPEYLIEKARTNIGRMAELTDSEHRVVRRNDIVFEEGADEANATVSRRHAHIRLDDGDYRLCDDESEFGTRVFRNGRAIEVPAGNRRGEKLRPGDEIYLGRACLRFEP
jgi:pSer/pThr/pTyr-binding forkhead associated (FHA) protein